MLASVSGWAVDQLVARNIIRSQRRAVYQYGCELTLSTAFSVLFILFAGLFLHRFLPAFIFIAFFMPVRTVSSGYHAPSYGRCFLLTNLIAFACVFGAARCLRMGDNLQWGMWLLFLAAHLFIWRRGPFRSRKHPLKEETIMKNRTYMHRIQMLEIAVAICFHITESRHILYTAVLATAAVALMIAVAEKEEGKNVGSISGNL